MITETESPASFVGGPDIHVWMTPEEAARTLSTPVENVERQLDEGDLDSRVNEDGMLEVLIVLPKRSSTAPTELKLVSDSEIAYEPETMPEEAESMADSQTELEPETRLSLVRETEEPITLGQTMLPLINAMRHTHTSGDEIRRARRAARRAWAAAAAIFVLAGGAVATSATYALRVRTTADQITQQLDQSTATAANLTSDKDTLAASQETLREANAELTAKLTKLTAEQDQLRTQLSQATGSLAKAQGDLVVERNVEDQLLQAALASHAAKGIPAKQVVADGSN